MFTKNICFHISQADPKCQRSSVFKAEPKEADAQSLQGAKTRVVGTKSQNFCCLSFSPLPLHHVLGFPIGLLSSQPCTYILKYTICFSFSPLPSLQHAPGFPIGWEIIIGVAAKTGSIGIFRTNHVYGHWSVTVLLNTASGNLTQAGHLPTFFLAPSSPRISPIP